MNRSSTTTAISVAVLIVGALFFLAYHRARNDLQFTVPTTVLHENIPFDVSISRNKEGIVAGDAARHRAIVQQEGKLADVSSEMRYPHFAIASHDLSDIAFYHIDRLSSPEAGVFDMDHIFSADSPYSIWFELNDNTIPNHNHHGEQSDYIVRFDVPVGQSEIPVEDRLLATDRYYQLRLEPINVAVGTPSTFKIYAEDIQGRPVPLFFDIDHFYFAASADGEFYVLDHPDLTLTKDNTITINNLVLPQKGSYALWVRVFTDGGGGQIEDLIEGSFVFSVD